MTYGRHRDLCTTEQTACQGQRAGASDASHMEHARVGGRQLEDLAQRALDEIRQAVRGFGERGKMPLGRRLDTEIPLPACF